MGLRGGECNRCVQIMCPVFCIMPSFGLSFEPQCTLSLLTKQMFFQLGPKNHGTFDFYVILFIEVSSCG